MITETVDASDGIPRVNVILTCPFCEKPSHVDNVPAEGFAAWRAGRHIQYALPVLTPGQAETLLTGSHEECFDKAFPADDL